MSNDDAIKRWREESRSREISRECIKDGKILPTTGELLSDAPFFDEDRWADIKRWAWNETSAVEWIHPRLRKILVALSLQDDRSVSGDLLKQARKEVERRRTEWSPAYVETLQAYALRLDLYLAPYLDPSASSRLAMAAWNRAITARQGPDQLGAVFVALRCLGRGAAPKRDANWIAELLAMSRAASEAEEKQEPLVQSEDALVLDFADLISDASSALPRLGLVVVPKLDHLPKSLMGRTDVPRQEFGPISNVALELRQVEELQIAKHSLCMRFPWAEDAIETMLRDLVGREWVRFRPTLLVGPAGAGKSRLAMKIAKALRVPATLYGAAGTADAAFGGTSRQWTTGRASVPLQEIKRANLANPVLVLDEIEKAGTSTQNGRLWDTLMPMLEQETAKAIFDPYLECPVDLSAVSYVATANSLAGIPTPLLDRFRVLEIPSPGPEHLPVIVAAMTEEIRQERGTDSLWMPDLDQEELALISERWSGGSMRLLRRLVETVLAGRETLAARH